MAYGGVVMKDKQLLVLIIVISMLLTAVSGVMGETQEESANKPYFLEEGKKYFANGNFEEALAQWQKVSKPESQLKDQSEKYQLPMLQGEAYRRLGQYQNAAYYFNTVLQEAKDANHSKIVTQCLEKLGTMAFEMGDREGALEILREGLSLARENNHSSTVAGLLNSVGNVLTSMDRNNEALGAYTEAAALAGKTHNAELEIIALINSAKAASQEGLNENSEERLDLALEKVDSLSDGYGKMNGLLTVGVFYGAFDSQKDISGRRNGEYDIPKVSSQEGRRGVRVEPGSGPQELEEIIVVPDPAFGAQQPERT